MSNSATPERQLRVPEPQGREGGGLEVFDQQGLSECLDFGHREDLPPPWRPYVASIVVGTAMHVVNTKATSELGWRPRFPTYQDGIDALVHVR
jgi:hypothetical protein